MAYSFNPTYTGKDSAVKFPELDALERASQRSGQMAIEGETKKLEQSLMDRDTFMKLMEVDPVMAINTRDQITQAALLDRYKNKGAEILRRDGGRLTEAGRMELMKEKALLTASQNKILGNQEKWKAAEQTITRDQTGFYDRDAYEKARQNYFNTGEWDDNALTVAPQDIIPLLGKDPAQSEYTDPKGTPYTDDKGNLIGHFSTKYKRTEAEAQEQIFSKLRSEPVLKAVIRDFESQPQSVQIAALKDYDINGNNRIDPDEMASAKQGMNMRDNPIVQWAMTHKPYIAASMGREDSTPKNKPGAGGTTFKWDLGITPSHNQNDQFQEQKNVYGYKSYYNLGRKSFTSDPQMIGTYKNADTGETNTLGTATRFEVVGYGADKDELVVKIVDDMRNKETGARVRKDDRLILKASQYDDLLRAKPFGIDRTALMQKYSLGSGNTGGVTDVSSIFTIPESLRKR